MKPRPVPYAEREAATLRAMAERTLADPTSSPEDFEAASRRLTASSTRDLGREYKALGPARRPWVYAAMFYPMPPEPTHGTNGLLHFPAYTRRLLTGAIVRDGVDQPARVAPARAADHAGLLALVGLDPSDVDQ